MKQRTAIKLAQLAINRSTNYSNFRRLNGIHMNNYIHHISDLLIVTNKKTWYVGFAMGFVFSLIMGYLMLIVIK